MFYPVAGRLERRNGSDVLALFHRWYVHGHRMGVVHLGCVVQKQFQPNPLIMGAHFDNRVMKIEGSEYLVC
jgi:hypothetical protein